jgi:hypothetical protein
VLEHEVIGPPPLVGVLLVIVTSLLYVAGFGVYVRAEGGMSLTVMVRVAVVEPPLLLAVTV